MPHTPIVIYKTHITSHTSTNKTFSVNKQIYQKISTIKVQTNMPHKQNIVGWWCKSHHQINVHFEDKQKCKK